MLKKLAGLSLLAISLCLAPSAGGAASAPAETDLLGDWVYPENGSVIRTYRCGQTICSKILKVADPNRRDTHNPDRTLRNRPLSGIVISSGLSRVSPTAWRGRFYRTLDGSTFEATVNIVDRNRIKMVDCLIGNLVCETTLFYRVGPPRPGDGAPATAAHDNAEADARPARTKPLKPTRKLAATPKNPSQADFEAFMNAKDPTYTAKLTAEQRASLYRDFLQWRRQTQTR